ncbi:Hypothetical predicted protein [Mytilus galloprovincialis]|uniref:Uncharacterized protein n=1 Tax=Mytilus galloprovincialis TaxID=29158 RepID=A0A8B6GBN3_MYTGA|nr:Hypothetical predicted protein [Mytilus galloprovincialis]
MASNDNTINYIMATGDFNDNQLAPVNSKITPLLSQFSLTQLIDEPTHFTESSSSLLDLFITNDAHIITYCGVGPPLLDQIRFHCPIIVLLNFPKCVQKTFKRKIWLYDRGDYDRYRNILSEKNWDSVINLNNVEQFTTEITKTIIEAAEKCIPNKIITVRKNEPPWLTNDVKKKIRKKNRIHRKAKKYNNPSDWSKFKKIRNEVTSLIRKSKEEYNNNLIKKIMNSSPSTTNWWKTVKQISGLKANDASVPPLMVNNNLIFDEIEKANEFNRFFSSQSNIDDSSAMLPEELKTISDDIGYIELTVTEVEDILKIVNPTKASGPDLISPKLLKEASSVLKYPLCKLFNLSLSTSTFPDQWKRANVTPVYKNSKPNDDRNVFGIFRG